MAKRCDNCKHWTESVFLGSSASGYGCWEGHCHNPKVPAPRFDERPRHNLMLACQHFEEGVHPDSLSGAAEAKLLNTEAQRAAAGGPTGAQSYALTGEKG